MGSYVPVTDAQRREMLAAIGVDALGKLYEVVPEELRVKEPSLPAGKSELEVDRMMAALAGKNKVYASVFRGAGAYRHYIPATVKAVVGKETFVTAYTPYQAEISQGILQSIFEYQTMIAMLTGMEASNASVYDGATAAAEAVAMCRDRKRTRALVSAAAHPDVIETIRTYCWGAGVRMDLVPVRDGTTDLAALETMLDDTVACCYLPQPNFFGLLEDGEAAVDLCHAAGAKLIAGVNPIAMALLKPPGEWGADIAVGEGQPLGMPLSFGGPYLGFMAASGPLVRKLPGRIVGQTTDSEGNRAFVLTLQAREQHIRREKASSNICSNQALCAMTAAVYMATMGQSGLHTAATQSMAKAHYLAEELGKAGYPLVHPGEFFHEFVTTCPVDPAAVLKRLDDNGILGGLPVPDGILWCATELNTKEEMDQLVSICREVAAHGA
ncbi:aminomethyl-transferring glycine dehydrogenase subunit GcvPA [Ruminococcaceae bacterium OttesenSCG-928-L11]|nr:aminomethyl-transferring glycine dehydrogenase subunit GcvPA [Ruminococcaceae bacterium OttesenSCG-928-L11]